MAAEREKRSAMDENVDHVGNAISEVGAALISLNRGRGKQVSSVDERDRLKSVSFAWFKSHRVHAQGVDLQGVDECFNEILDCTERRATRTIYSKLLKRAKAELVSVRRELIALSVSKSPVALDGELNYLEHPPEFSAIVADAGMQSILERRWSEIQRCNNAGAYLAATVMMGGLLESLLLSRINKCSNKNVIYTAKTSPRDKHGKAEPLSQWKLVAMVEVAHEVGWITKSARDVGNVLRDFRNYIHPHKELTDGIKLTAEDSSMFWEVSKSICRQILESSLRSP